MTRRIDKTLEHLLGGEVDTRIEMMAAALTDLTAAPFEAYLDTFDLTEDDISNKTILDVGAGLADFTARAYELGSLSVALDPGFSKTGQVQACKDQLEMLDNAVKARDSDSLEGPGIDPNHKNWPNLAYLVGKTSSETFPRFERDFTERRGFYIPGLASSIPFRDGAFDAIFSYRSMPKIIYPDFVAAGLMDMFRVLKPGGTMYLSHVPHLPSYNPSYVAKELERLSASFTEKEGVPDDNPRFRDKTNLHLMGWLCVAYREGSIDIPKKTVLKHEAEQGMTHAIAITKKNEKPALSGSRVKPTKTKIAPKGRKKKRKR